MNRLNGVINIPGIGRVSNDNLTPELAQRIKQAHPELGYLVDEIPEKQAPKEQKTKNKPEKPKKTDK